MVTAGNFSRRGVVSGFALVMPASGLTPAISRGVLFASSVMYRPGADPGLSAAPASALSYLGYANGSGFYWTSNPDGDHAADAVVGWVRTDGSDVLAVSSQAVVVGSSGSGGGGGTGGGGVVAPALAPGFVTVRKSVLEYGAIGDGVADDAAAFNTAAAAGGAYIPSGYTFLVKSAIAVAGSCWFVGDGAGSLVKRGDDLGAGVGLFDVTGGNVYLANFAIDGDVTTAAGVLYSTLATAGYDPMQDLLTRNSSIWVHGDDAGVGVLANVVLDTVLIQHTGGYAVLLDAREGDIRDVSILNPYLLNNRPHLFGTSGGDLSYGSWTGGIHYQGDCETGAHFAARTGGASVDHLWSVKGLLVSGGTFRRNVGNCIWGHAYAFDAMHTNVRVVSNYFEDCGRDAVELAVTSGGSVSGNKGRRIGYVAVDDTSAAVPKFLGGQYAVFVDTSGATGVDYTGNSAISVYGGFLDLDGFAQGTVSGNVCRVPVVGEVEYAEDAISTWAGNYAYGIQTANTYFADGGKNVSILGNTLINLGLGAIRLFSARGCHVSGNTINHPAAAAFAPIVLGNFTPPGSGVTYTRDCSVVENNIQWSPGSALAAVQELEDWGAGTMVWSSTDKNWVAGNRLFGTNLYEFSRAASSGSVTGTVISSQGSGLTGSAQVRFSRERVSTVDFTSMYAPNGDLLWRVLDSIGQFNASKNGVAGSVTTGARLGSLAVDDTVATSHLYGDGALVLTDSTLGAEVNVLSDSYGLIRYNSTAKKFEKSVSVASGARVWDDLVPSAATVAGSNTQVQFNDGGVLGAHGGLTYVKATSVLTAGGGVITPTFSSSATGATAAFQQASGTFVITGAGNAAFQSLTLTTALALSQGGTGATTAAAARTALGVGTGDSPTFVAVTAGTFNSTATGATAAFQQAGGTFVITGAGNAAFQSLTLTTALALGQGGTGATTAAAARTALGVGTGDSPTFVAVTAGTFNSTATGATAAFQQAGGTFVITGAGNAAFQSLTLTTALALGQGGTGATTAAAARTALGVGTGDSPSFAAVAVGGAAVINGSHSFVGTGGVLVPHAASCAAGNFYITKNDDVNYISGLDGNFLDQGGTARYFVGGLYIGTSAISR